MSFRFGTSSPRALRGDVEGFVAGARAAERLGFSTFSLGEHLTFPFDPLVAMQVALAATTSLQVTASMLVADFRHPAVLAKHLRTLQMFYGPRVEVGLGAGWMETDYVQTGIPFSDVKRRIARLEEYVAVVNAILGSSEPVTFRGEFFELYELQLASPPSPIARPRIMVGGGGKRILAAAARIADIVQVAPYEAVTQPKVGRESVAARLESVRAAAGDRLAEIELSLPVTVWVDPDEGRGARTLMEHVGPNLKYYPTEGDLTEAGILDSPCYAVGSAETITEKLQRLKQDYGFSYLILGAPGGLESVRPVLDALRGA